MNLHGVAQVGQLRLQFRHQAGHVRYRLLHGAQVVGHLVHAGRKTDHRCHDLAFRVPYILLKAALNHGHGRVRLAGIVDGLLHQHLQRRKLLILRALQVPDLLLQLRHIALQFLYFLAGRKRQRGRRNQNPYAKTREHMQLSFASGGETIGPSPRRRVSCLCNCPTARARSARAGSSASRTRWTRCTAAVPCRS